MSTLAATNLKHASSASNNIVLDSSGNATFAGTPVPASSFLRNRIINGDMRIDQRNAGASVTVNDLAQFWPVDRWYAAGQSSDGVFTVQQVSDAPSGSGFNKSIKATVTTADASIGSTQVYFLAQRIEGFNTADFDFGSASAKTVTVSFSVKSSLTGSFGGRIGNSGSSRTYPFSYTISAANTWETKTVTIAGDTTGTWLTTNGIGVDIIFSLGVGSSKKGTVNTWASADYLAPTSSVDLISTLNATFYLTGVQLEVGTAATPFERRQYGQELMLCQRYYQRVGRGTSGGTSSTTAADLVGLFPTQMRASPTVSFIAGSGTSALVSPGTSTTNITAIASSSSSAKAFYISVTSSGLTAARPAIIAVDEIAEVSAEL